jgi:hypothetical protein
MHPKYWKFPGGRRFMDTANDADGQGSSAGGSAAPTEAEKAAAAEAERVKAEEAAAAAAAGKPQPSDAEAKLLKEVMQKKEALRLAQEESAAAKARLAEFDGIDPAAVRKLLAEQREAEEAALLARGEFDTIKARMAEEHTRATASLQEQLAAIQAQLAAKDGVINELSIGTQFSQSEFISQETTIPPSKARKLYGEHFDVVDGKVVAYDKPRGETGRTQLIDALGNSLDFDNAMRRIVEADPDKDHLLKSKVKTGAGSQSKPNAAPSKPNAPVDSVSRISGGLKGLLTQNPNGGLM